MENYIIELISVAGTFIAAYLGSLWALKNVKKEKYFEERKQIYYELASILPIIDTCITQSDYLQDCQLGGTAENKIVIMEMKLHDAEDRLKIMQIEISNWEYRIKRHKEYLQEMGELHKKLEEFDKSGKKNLLRLFASARVWNSYVELSVALHNEYYCNLGVVKEDIVHHVNNLIFYMRNDLQG